MNVWIVVSEAYNWRPEAVFSTETEADKYASMGDMEVEGPFTVDDPQLAGEDVL